MSEVKRVRLQKQIVYTYKGHPIYKYRLNIPSEISFLFFLLQPLFIGYQMLLWSISPIEQHSLSSLDGFKKHEQLHVETVLQRQTDREVNE